jgi:hypothetical protein
MGAENLDGPAGGRYGRTSSKICIPGGIERCWCKIEKASR